MTRQDTEVSAINRVHTLALAGFLASSVTFAEPQAGIIFVHDRNVIDQETSSASSLSQWDMDDFGAFSILEVERAQIKGLLEGRPDIVRFLRDTGVELQRQFGDRAELLVEFISDYDDDGQSELLICVADKFSDFDHLYANYEEFVGGWWKANKSKSRGVFNITLG